MNNSFYKHINEKYRKLVQFNVDGKRVSWTANIPLSVNVQYGCYMSLGDESDTSVLEEMKRVLGINAQESIEEIFKRNPEYKV